MTGPELTPAALVTAYLGGNRDALGALYDLYAPALYDTAAAMLGDRHEAADVVQDTFLVAAERMRQLRDPERIKAWLFAIARHEIYRRTKRRRRFTPSEKVPEMAAPDDVTAEGANVSHEELAALVREAAMGLDERDQLVLELSVRQGLQGADLAAALGVTAEQSYTLVHRMRERVERTIGAVVVARKGRKDCPELQQVLLGWDGTFSVLWRKRIARHIESCDTCERTRRAAAPLALLGSAPAFALPVGLREAVLSRAGSPAATTARYRFSQHDGFPTSGIGAKVGALVAAIIAVVVLAVGGVLLLARASDDDSTAAPLPTSPVVVVSTTGVPATVAAAPSSVPTTVPASSSTSTTSTPATTVKPLPAEAATTTPAPPAPPAPPPPPGGDETPPSVRITSVIDDGAKTCQTSTIAIKARAGDESGIASVRGRWSGPAGSDTFSLTRSGSDWVGTIIKPGGFGQANGGDYRVVVTATDIHGNRGSDRDAFHVEICPG